MINLKDLVISVIVFNCPFYEITAKFHWIVDISHCSFWLIKIKIYLWPSDSQIVCRKHIYIYTKSFFTSFQLVLQRTWAPDTETNQANRRKHLNYLEVGKKMTCGRDRFVAQNLAGLHACCGLNKTCMSKYHACAVRSEVFSRRKSQKSSDMGQ